MKEVEQKISKMPKEWIPERIAYEDEEGEPFRVFITLRYEKHELQESIL